MDYINRNIEREIRRALGRKRSVMLFGARQTGKTTLVNRLSADLSISLVNPATRQRYERNPFLLCGEVEALCEELQKPPVIVIDEMQKVPALLDAVQYLIDRQTGLFVLTGSSARKLRRDSHANLLPGRVAVLRLDPLSLMEYQPPALEDLLLYGSLPGIVAVQDSGSREQDLGDYVVTYLEEEIRSEALVRNLGAFARFLELAAAEAGGIVNMRKLASEIGVAHTTIASYYQILEDCLICDRIEPLTASATRKRLTRSDKYLFFDTGVRRLAAREGSRLLSSRMGAIFEQFVGQELLRWSRTQPVDVRIRFWRDPGGPEVDWVIDQGGKYLPIEVKWTDTPRKRDGRHVELFMKEYPTATKGYVVCRTSARVKLGERLYAVPWNEFFTKELGKGNVERRT